MPCGGQNVPFCWCWLLSPIFLVPWETQVNYSDFQLLMREPQQSGILSQVRTSRLSPAKTRGVALTPTTNASCGQTNSSIIFPSRSRRYAIF